MNIWVPRTKILEPELVLPGTKVGGRFRITGRLDDGRSRVLAEWQPNLITDYGLNAWGTTTIFNKCSLGTSNQEPSVLDTKLIQFVRVANSSTNAASGASTSPPYYGFYRADYIFNPPGTDLNVSEIGMGVAVDGTQLWSRALIKDINGDPLILSWKANETLTVTYEARSYPWLNDVLHETVISGVTYTGIMRVSSAGHANNAFNGGVQTMSDGNWIYALAMSGTIGPITGGPSGTQGYANPLTTNAYQNNSRERTGSAVWGPTVANYAGGIQSFQLIPTTHSYQISMNPPIMKLNTHTLTINHTSGVWGRQ